MEIEAIEIVRLTIEAENELMDECSTARLEEWCEANDIEPEDIEPEDIKKYKDFVWEFLKKDSDERFEEYTNNYWDEFESKAEEDYRSWDNLIQKIRYDVAGMGCFDYQWEVMTDWCEGNLSKYKKS